jgi:cyclic beta-1,2-glucan synthetase
VSGDWPIVLATVDSLDGLPTVAELLRAHRYWRRRGMTVDLVLLNTRGASYVQDLTEKLTAAVRASSEAPVNEQPGGVVVRRKDLLRPEEMQMLRATARVHVACDGRKLGQIVDPGQVDLRRAAEEAGSTRGPLQRLGIGLADRLRVPTPGPEKAARVEAPEQTVAAVDAPARPSLQLDNGSADSPRTAPTRSGSGAPASRRALVQRGGQRGREASCDERGGGFNWAGSSYFFRLTPGTTIRSATRWVTSSTCETRRPARCGRRPRGRAPPARGTRSPCPGLSTFTHQHEEISVELTMGLDERVGAKVSRLACRTPGTAPVDSR